MKGTIFAIMNAHQYDYDRVKRVSRHAPGKDLFALDKLFFPVCSGKHWILVVVFVSQKQIDVCNSLGQTRLCTKVKTEILFYLQREHKDKKGREMDVADWTLYGNTPCASQPVQENSE